MRATSERLAAGSSDAATSRSFSSCDHRRRRSNDVITSALEIVIALLLGLPLGPAAFASVKQGGPQRRNTGLVKNVDDFRRHALGGGYAVKSDRFEAGHRLCDRGEFWNTGPALRRGHTEPTHGPRAHLLERAW